MTPLPLLLALAIPAAPAPKAEKGLPKDLVDLIPADTAGIVVCDLPKIAGSELGKFALRTIGREQAPDFPVPVADLVKESEQVVLAQFLIDKGTGDLCVIVRHKEGATFVKALTDRADKAGKDTGPERIGKRTVYSLKNADFSFAKIDDRTVMLVLASGDRKQVQETREAAYGERDKPGPSEALRKMLADGDDRPVRLYGSHPKKLGLSAHAVLLLFGVRDKAIEEFHDRLVSYRGGVKLGEAGEIEVRIRTKDADTAKAVVKSYEAGGESDAFLTELRKSAKAVRDGDD